MRHRIKLIVAGSLLALTALALGLTMSVVFNANAGTNKAATAQNNVAQSNPAAQTKPDTGTNDDEDFGFSYDFDNEFVTQMFDKMQGMGVDVNGVLAEISNFAGPMVEKFGGKGVLADGPETQGVITKVENNGAKITVNNRVVTLDGATLGDGSGSITKESLKVGDRVVAVGTVASDKSLTAKYLLRLTALPKAFLGDLISVDSGANSLKFKSKDVEWTATVNSDGKVYKDGTEVKLADLKVGDKVTVIGITDETAKTVKASQVSQGRPVLPKLGNIAGGKVKSVDAANNTFTVSQTERGTGNTTEVKVTVDANTKYIGTDVKSLADLKVDDLVVVRGEKQTDGSVQATEVGKATQVKKGQGGMMGGFGGNMPGKGRK